MSALEGGADIEYGCLTLPLLTDPDIGRSFYSRCSKALYVGWRTGEFSCICKKSA